MSYRVRQHEEEQGDPVTRILPRSLLVPPGIPDFASRARIVDSGPCVVTGRAWSGHGPIVRVEVSDDAGAIWRDAELDGDAPQFAWRGWRFEWSAGPGEHELCCRATDAAGNVQPDTAEWNLDGFCNNAVQRVAVTVR